MAKSRGIQDARKAKIIAAWKASPLASSLDIEVAARASIPTVYKYYPFPCYGFKILTHKQIARYLDLHRDVPFITMHGCMGKSFPLQSIKKVAERMRRAGGIDVCRNITTSQPATFWDNSPERVPEPKNKTPYTPREPAGMKEQLEIFISKDGSPRIGNLREALIPFEMLDAVENVLEHGAKKHGTNDWAETPQKWSLHFNAVLRHLKAWHERKGPDAESGESPLAHAVARLSFLIALEARGLGNDNRPRK